MILKYPFPKPHVHAELIDAWRLGAEIQVKTQNRHYQNISKSCSTRADNAPPSNQAMSTASTHTATTPKLKSLS